MRDDSASHPGDLDQLGGHVHTASVLQRREVLIVHQRQDCAKLRLYQTPHTVEVLGDVQDPSNRT